MDSGGQPSARAFAALRRRAWALAGVLVLAATLLHASAGIRWSRHFHPDELQVAHWLKQSLREGRVTDRVYPGGWFVLADLSIAVARPFHEAARRLGARTAQDGAVVATDESTFRSEPERARFPDDPLQWGRNLNVLLFAASALLLLLCAREIGASPPAAALAALLFAVQPFALEHAHYCETDAAPLCFLCLAGWLALGALRRGSGRRAAAACAAAGFAVACKYTLAPLLLWAPALALALARRADARRGRAFASLLAAGLGAFALGFLAGTPALVLDPAWFLRDAARISDRTYREAWLALGHRPPFAAACAWRAASLAREAAKLGPATLALLAACLPLWLLPARRRFLWVFPLFAAVFPLHCVLSMPWIRNQELLPLLPALCLGAAPALDAAAGALRRRPVRAARAAAAALLLALFAAALADSFRAGRRILSCFERRDTRAECQNWLAACAPDGLAVAHDRYVGQALRGTPCRGVDAPGFAASWPKFLHSPAVLEEGARYALRNGSHEGRRVRGEGMRKAVARFEREALPLAAWRPASGAPRTATFCQPDAELWALPAPDGSPPPPDVPLALDRPLFFSPGLRPLYATAERSPGVGPVRAVAAVGQRHAVHPADGDGPLWAVARVLGGPAAGSVEWSGLFLPRRAAVDRGAALFELDRPAFRRRAAADVFPEAKVRLRGADDQATVCAAFLSSDPVEAARALRRAGAAREALDLLRSRPEDAACRAEACLAAKAAGEAPSKLEAEAARAALDAYDAATDSGAEPSVRGVPMAVLRDFARIRIPDGPCPAAGALPVFLPAGRYRVAVLPDTALPAPDPDSRWFEGQEGSLAEETDGAGSELRVATVRMRRDGLLRSPLLADPAAPALHWISIEVGWDPADLLRRAADELRAALAGEP